jgi:hypothetical protein
MPGAARYFWHTERIGFMADIAYDISIESGSVPYVRQSSNPVVTCSEGRVVLAATAWQNWIYSKMPVPAWLIDSSGAPGTDVELQVVGDPGTITYPVVTYQLTTAKIATL